MKKEIKKISIIIVNWNGKKWLQKCLKCLENQTYKNIEILVVDNASSDDSIEFISKNYPKIKIIANKKNLGFSSGNNLGIRSSKGEYIMILNNDTWAHKKFVEQLLNFYKTNNLEIVAPTEKRYWKDVDFNCNTTLDLFGFPAYYVPRYKKNKVFFLSGVCLLFSRKIYLETQGLDNNFFMYFEDADWFWRLNLMNKKFGYAENIFIRHAGAGGLGYGIKYHTILWKNQNILQMLLKNYSSLFLTFILPLYFIQNIVEILLFLIILKPKIAYSYIEGWIFNLKNIKNILKKRAWVQKHRVVDDLEIIKKMYFGSGKLLQLKQRFNIL